MLKAFKNLDFPIIIAGSGKDEKKLKRAIKETKNIHYVGRVVGKKKIEVIKNAKFLIMPSRYEAQGIVALEAAALRKPLIVSDIPSLSYVVENGFGISFKSEDAEDLKNKVLVLWNNDELLQNFSKNARNYAKNFTWEKISEQFESYLYRILND
ncbi:glycosyltransferase family 4 protein [Thermodesulfovibrio hydrogeniphilus]